MQWHFKTYFGKPQQTNNPFTIGTRNLKQPDFCIKKNGIFVQKWLLCKQKPRKSFINYNDNNGNYEDSSDVNNLS